MPRISSFNVRQDIRVDERVQSANISTAGAGAVARAVGQLGTQGANMANQFLQIQKQDQADNFSRRARDTKEVARQKQASLYQSEMDSATGLLKDGRSYLQAMTEWEDSVDKQIESEAPTELASRKYRGLDASRRNRSLVGAELFQQKELQQYTVDSDKSAIDTKSKEILGIDQAVLESTGRTLKGFVDEAELDLRSRVASGVSKGIYTENEARKIYENGASSYANAYFNSLVKFNNNLSEAIKELDAPVLAQGEELEGELGTAVAGLAGVSKDKIEKVVTLEDGSVGVFLKNGKQDIRVDPNTGEIVSVRRPDITKMVLEPIDVEGEVKDTPKLSRFITPADKKGHMLGVLNKINANNKKSNAKLLREVDNAVVAYSSTGPEKLRYRPGVQGHAGTEVITNLVSKIKTSNLPEQTKVDKYADLFGAVVQGDISDVTTWDSTSAALSKINSASLEEVSKTFGLGDLGKDPLFGKRVISSVRARLSNNEQIRARQTLKPEYIMANDPEAGKEFEDFQTAEGTNDISIAREALGSFKRIVGARQDQLGLPEFARSVYPSAYLSQVSSDLNNLLLPETGFTGKTQLAERLQSLKAIHGEDFYSFLTDLKSRGGLNEAVVQSALFPKTAEGVKAQALALDVASNYKTIAKNFNDLVPGGEGKVRRQSRQRLSPYLKSLRGSTNTSEYEKQSLAYVDFLAGRAMQLGGTKDAVDQAFKELYVSNFYTYSRGRNNAVFLKSELDRANVSEEVADATMRHFAKGSNLLGYFSNRNIDYAKYVPDLIQLGKSKSEIKDNFLDMLDRGNVQIKPVAYGDRMIFRLADRNDIWSEPLMDSDGNLLEIELKDLNKIPGVVNESKKTTFFGFDIGL